MAQVEAPSGVIVTAVLPRKVRVALVGGAVALGLAIALCVILVVGLRDVVTRNCQFISAVTATRVVERDVFRQFQIQADAQASTVPPAQRAQARKGRDLIARLVARYGQAERRDAQIRDRPPPLRIRLVGGCSG